VTILNQNGFNGNYGFTADGCTGPVMDNTFVTALGSTSANGTTPVSFGMNMNAGGPAGPCSITINDGLGDSALLNISVDQTTITVLGHRRKPGSTR
jgi:hypothetical protein